MVGALVTLLGLLQAGTGQPAVAAKPLASFSYEEAEKHEVKPHRRTIPTKGVREGFNQLHLTLVVSAAGDVTKAEAAGDEAMLKFWPALQGEVEQWHFEPFASDGHPVEAQVEEYIDLVPPERLPAKHVQPPAIRPDSKVTITLERSGCMGSCPAYSVALSTSGILFEGHYYVAALGEHTDSADADTVRAFAKRLIAADFYSMNPDYSASVTDCPTYMLSVSIDGRSKSVHDYMGAWVGMPAVVADLEEETDRLARTDRWIEASDGLVQSLAAERLDFGTYQAQVLLKEAARRGQTATVEQLLQSGVSLEPLPAPKPEASENGFRTAGWLQSASSHADLVHIFIGAGASRKDQTDKDLGLLGAATAGNVEAARELIAYGANPNADLAKLTVTQEGGGMTLQEPGSGSILISAAASGNPDMIRLILEYRPKLEARDSRGQTAIFAAGEYRSSDKDGARKDCVRLLAEAGADVNAQDRNGNTALHEVFLPDVEEELLKLGADVNARNKDGETPIFTTVDDEAMALFIAHGANLALRNEKGQTVLEAAEEKGPTRQEALRKAIQDAAAGKQ